MVCRFFRFISLWLIVGGAVQYTLADEPVDTLELFLENNPYAVQVNILNEGTVAFLCSDDDNLFIRVAVGNPMLFMRMLMQGLTVYVDPTGRNKEKYSLIFPSAENVRHLMNDNKQRQYSKTETINERPDIFPLLNAINEVGVIYDVNGISTKLSPLRSLIDLDEEDEIISFCVLMPKTGLMNEKKLSSTWSLGIYLDSVSENIKEPRNNDNTIPPPHPYSEFEEKQNSTSNDINHLMKKKINEWATFNIDEVNNINLK